MTEKNFIFSMKPYDVDAFVTQVAWILEKRTELASRKRLPGIWKLTDKLNASPRADKAELKRRKEQKRRWGGLFLVMGIFLFVPGIMKPQELPVPLFAGFLGIVLGILYLRNGEKKKNSYEKKAKKLLNHLNEAAEKQKLRLIFGEKELTLGGTGEEEKVSYASMECVLETKDLFGLIYENRILLLQKQELLLGTEEEFRKQLKEKTEMFYGIPD